jgi:hypothetical protein
LGFRISDFGFYGSFSASIAYRIMLHKVAFFDYEYEDGSEDDLSKTDFPNSKHTNLNSMLATPNLEPTVRHVFQSEIQNPKSEIERP